jgi:hypothetical protein
MFVYYSGFKIGEMQSISGGGGKLSPPSHSMIDREPLGVGDTAALIKLHISC